MGLAVGFVIRQVRRRLDNPPVEITISILSGYFAYLPAEALGVSGVLAAVTVGIYMGWHTPQLTHAQTRLQGVAVWEILFFVLNALLFTLIGLQLPVILDASLGPLDGDAHLVRGADRHDRRHRRRASRGSSAARLRACSAHGPATRLDLTGAARLVGHARSRVTCRRARSSRSPPTPARRSRTAI